jgi:hypothetical protein
MRIFDHKEGVDIAIDRQRPQTAMILKTNLASARAPSPDPPRDGELKVDIRGFPAAKTSARILSGRIRMKSMPTISVVFIEK